MCGVMCGVRPFGDWCVIWVLQRLGQTPSEACTGILMCGVRPFGGWGVWVRPLEGGV